MRVNSVIIGKSWCIVRKTTRASRRNNLKTLFYPKPINLNSNAAFFSILNRFDLISFEGFVWATGFIYAKTESYAKNANTTMRSVWYLPIWHIIHRIWRIYEDKWAIYRFVHNYHRQWISKLWFVVLMSALWRAVFRDAFKWKQICCRFSYSWIIWIFPRTFF